MLNKAEVWGYRLENTNPCRSVMPNKRRQTLPMIGRLLGHANHQSTARYAHLDDEHLLDAAQQVGDVVEHLMGATLKSRAESDIS